MKRKVFSFSPPKQHLTHYQLLIIHYSSISRNSQPFTYKFIIFQIKAENEISIDLQIPEDDETLNNIEDFQTPLKGKTIDIIAKLFHYIMDKNIIIPPDSFTFSKGPFVKCSYKANDGVLYFLEKSILFVHKPVLEIEHESIKEVDLARIQVSSLQQRSFDITIRLKKDKEEFQFSGLDRDEIDILQQYMNAKKIKLNNKDEDNNNIDMPHYTTTSSRRAPVSDELPELPSENEMADEDYNDSGEDNDDYGEDDEDEDEEEEEEEKEKKKKNKKKKVKEE